MPTKSNNMSPMPMQPKIGEASLKFGPDWLRALSSSETPGNPNSTNSGGDSGGRHGFGFSGWGGGTSDHHRSGHSSNHKDYSASNQFATTPYNHQQLNQSVKEGKGNSPSNSISTRFKPSEHRFTREEMLALYDKNLVAPSFLLNLGTLYIEKMHPPLAFSQPSEEEIRIWHSPQPESSRQGLSVAPIGRGYAVRGRGSGIDRGRGRGRGSYYGGRPHEEEDRGSFSRPRNFERSQSVHERAAWVERNGTGPPGVPLTPEEGARPGGSWRSRESFGGRRHEEGNDDGWRKPRWRRGDEEEEGHRNSGNSRRLHRSWSEDENHDNIPEWAKDNPMEESGTFDASGAFHGEDRVSRNREFDRKADNDSMKSRVESEPSGSHNDRVQKRNPDRSDSVKPVIPASVKEEPETLLEKSDHSASINRVVERQEHFSATDNPVNSIIHHQKIENDMQKIGQDKLPEKQYGSMNIIDSQQHKQHVANLQHKMSSVSHDSRLELTHSSQTVLERSNTAMQQQTRIDMRASVNSHDPSSIRIPNNRNIEDDHYRSMTEEAMNLVSKLIEDDGSRSNPAIAALQARRGPTNAIPQQLLTSIGNTGNVTNSLTSSVAMNDISRNPGLSNIPVANIANPVHAPPVSPASFDVWFYRDPQGSVQGPFTTEEMGQWYTQGYFTAKLLLRRECDKVFITLSEMGKLYNRNPFVLHPDSPPPPPIQDPASSALDYSRGDINVQAQAQLQQRQQQLLQQNILREQQQAQLMMNLSHGRKEESAWQGQNISHASQSQPNRAPPNPSALTPEQMQAQLLMNMAKSQGLNPDRDSNTMDHLQALFQRQYQMKNNAEGILNQQSQKNEFVDLLTNRHNSSIDNSKSPVPPSDPIQSLVHQLTSMTNTQHQIQHPQNKNQSNKPDINPWGSGNVIHQSSQGQWGTHPSSVPWDYQNQKMQQEEELRTRKEEEEAERKRLQEEERKRLEEQQRLERKRLEEQRLEDEKQRKIREEQYLLQKQQEELLKQQQEAELARQKEMNRQKELMIQRQLEQQRLLEQQRQMRDEQTRLAEEQQRIEQQRQEKERKEKERLDMMRQERERQEQHAKMQQFTWNAAAQQPMLTGSKTLLEIQQEEAINQEKESILKKKQQQEQLRQQQEQQQIQHNKAINLKWAQGAAPQAKVAIKSLTEIQAEEQAKLQKQQEKEREKRATIQHQQNQQQAWSAQLTWANRASVSSANGSSKSNGGVWGDESSVASKVKSSSNNQSPSSNNRPQQASTGKRAKDVSDESFMKLFSVQEQEGVSPKGNRPKQSPMGSAMNSVQDDFTRWCFDKVQGIGGGSVDIPTFVGFLKEVESPYEVGDYVRSYLGDGKEARDFSREFLERRSRWKNARKDGGGSFEDNLCRPASAVNPNQNDFQEVKAKGKKTKKGKMQKVDSRILGFSTSAATDRLNVGNRDYGDSTD